MPQEKIERLERRQNKDRERLASIENSLENVTPLVVALVGELKEVTKELHSNQLVMTRFIASHDETARAIIKESEIQEKNRKEAREFQEKMEEGIRRRFDRLEDQVSYNTGKIAAAEPVLVSISGFSQKAVYFSLFLIALTVTGLGVAVDTYSKAPKQTVQQNTQQEIKK